MLPSNVVNISRRLTEFGGYVYIIIVFRTAFLDQEWFSFETAGTLVVGWEGGPSRQVRIASTYVSK